MKQDIRITSPHTFSQYMKEGNVSVRFVTRNIQQQQDCGIIRKLHINKFEIKIQEFQFGSSTWHSVSEPGALGWSKYIFINVWYVSVWHYLRDRTPHQWPAPGSIHHTNTTTPRRPSHTRMMRTLHATFCTFVALNVDIDTVMNTHYSVCLMDNWHKLSQ